MSTKTDLGKSILEALGVDLKYVTSVRIDMAPDKPSVVTITRHVQADEQPGLVELVKRYRLEPTE